MKVRLREGLPTRSVLRGILLIGRGRRAGLAEFGSSPDAFLASLAPLLAFPLVGAALMMVSGKPRAAAVSLLGTVIALLAPTVLSYEPAKWWKRQAYWTQYATALNWCQWLVPLLAGVLLILIYPPLAMAFGDEAAGYAVVGLLAGYGLWLHWFIARHGLAISRVRAAILVVLVNVCTIALVVVPQAVWTGQLSPAVP